MKIEWHPAAAEEIAALDRTVQTRILRTLQQKVIDVSEPSVEPYRGDLKGFHKIRVGSYRLVCRVQRDRSVLTVLLVAHRSEVYSRHGKGAVARRADK